MGFQIGGSSTDLIMLVMSERGAEKLLESKFTLGAEGSVAAGPVGRTATAQTDAQMHADILSWSRSQGLFAGIALEGATLRQDLDDNATLYGKQLENRDIVTKGVRAPEAAAKLLALLNRYSAKERGRIRSRMSIVVKAAVVAAMVVAGLFAPRPAAAYSVLAHEANIDALWDSTIAPMLRARFPEASPEQIQEARGYAYGGCVIQDLGYYPFGSHFFSNLLHYVRTGDFIEALIRDAQDVDEYAFALGALGHYAADNEGHPLAVNRAVALMYPKLKKQFGNRVTYAQSPKNHVLVEFSFDVVQVAAAAYAPEAYHTLHRLPGGQAAARTRLQRDVRHRDEGHLLQRGPGDRHLPARRRDHHSGDDEGGVGQETRRDP